MVQYWNNGVEVFPVTINSFAPMAIASVSRDLALLHMREWEKNPSLTLDQMFPQLIAPLGSSEPTHLFCSRNGFTHQVEMLDTHMAQREEPWVAPHHYDEESFDPDLVLTQFCVVLGDTAAILARLGMYEVTNG